MTGSNAKFLVIGNIYAQGTDQPVGFTDPGIVRYTNPYMIVKDRYEVNGSQATNVGYVNLGNGDYRWFMYGEQEARKRFEDKRELMLLFGEKRDGTGATDLDNAWLDLKVTSLPSRTEVSRLLLQLLTQWTLSLSLTTSSWSWTSRVLLRVRYVREQKAGLGYRRHVGSWYRYWCDRWSPRSVRCIPELC